jgi:hypothetical protein
MVKTIYKEKLLKVHLRSVMAAMIKQRNTTERRIVGIADDGRVQKFVFTTKYILRRRI